MPELPSVEFSRRLLQEHFAGSQIQRIDVAEDSMIFGDLTEYMLKSQMHLKTIEKIERHGKFIWLVLSEDGNHSCLLMHFGMTGFVQVRGAKRFFYKSAPEKEDNTEVWPPKYTKLIVKAETMDGQKAEFVFGDARRLGQIKLIVNCNNPRTVPPLNELGFDAFLEMPPLNDFSKMLTRKIGLKSLLLDQSFAAGIGNWMADDVSIQFPFICCRLCTKPTFIHPPEFAILAKSRREIYMKRSKPLQRLHVL